MLTLFVADLHLGEARPEPIAQFIRLTRRAEREAEAFYILGDLFELWLGDDDLGQAHRTILDALAGLSRAGCKIFFAHGNRDFLCGARFAELSGATLLPDYTTVELAGLRALVTHGDLLCTRDVKYQRFRKVVRARGVQALFRSIPLSARRWMAGRTRAGTVASMRNKSDVVMDVEQSTVEQIMCAHRTDVLIHGHTHRPAVHRFSVDGVGKIRYVLGDWYGRESVLIHNGTGLELKSIEDYLAGTPAA